MKIVKERCVMKMTQYYNTVQYIVSVKKDADMIATTRELRKSNFKILQLLV